ncbi:MAG: sugar isomerase [Flavobacteriales bacterium]|nr:MAG: sugar isomerase [Flavobacteriales bacterium]
MGIVINQSFKNTLVLFLGFAIGGINVLFLFTHFLHEDYYGLITFLLSSANIIMPLMVLGMQNTVIKFFSSYTTKAEQDKLLSASLLLPLLVIIPVSIVGLVSYNAIAGWLASENAIIKPYAYLIVVVSLFMGYFEIFYAFTKVHLQSVAGNILKEVFVRICTTGLLFAVYLEWLTQSQFIYAVVIVYGIRMVLMMRIAFRLCKPELSFGFPNNTKEVISYSLFIVLAGSASIILLDIDKFIIPKLKEIANVAYYAVGIYIAQVVAIPSRAMQQIINPLTAKEINADNVNGVAALYRKSSISLLVAGGLMFLLINCNIFDLYRIINRPEYTAGTLVVLLISISELTKLAIGNNGAILINSRFYKFFFYISIAMTISVILLDIWFINAYAINGAALATLLVVLVFSGIKIYYVYRKLNIQPFNKQTFVMLLVIMGLFLVFYFLKWPFNPWINIFIKSVLITVLYLFITYKLQISMEINQLFLKFLKR